MSAQRKAPIDKKRKEEQTEGYLRPFDREISGLNISNLCDNLFMLSVVLKLLKSELAFMKLKV